MMPPGFLYPVFGVDFEVIQSDLMASMISKQHAVLTCIYNETGLKALKATSIS